MAVLSFFQNRMDAWIAARNPATADSIFLHNRRLYILPTRFGYLFAIMQLVLLLAAINYQNSMAYVLTFLLTALGIISLWQTHKNLLGLSIRLKTPRPVYQQEELILEFVISHSNLVDRYAIANINGAFTVLLIGNSFPEFYIIKRFWENQYWDIKLYPAPGMKQSGGITGKYDKPVRFI